MTRKEKIQTLRQISMAALNLNQAAYNLKQCMEEPYLNYLFEDNVRIFSTCATINMKLLSSLLEPSGFKISFEDPQPEIGQKEFLDIAAVEATMAGKNWE